MERTELRVDPPKKIPKREPLGIDNIVGMLIYVVVLATLISYIISTFRADKGD